MSAPLTVRLSARTERALDALARRRRQTRSDVVREAIDAYSAAQETGDRTTGPYQQWSDVVGVVRSGGRGSGKTTGELFTELVIRKARARRPR